MFQSRLLVAAACDQVYLLAHDCIESTRLWAYLLIVCFFFFQAEDGIRYLIVTGVQTCALPISPVRDQRRGPLPIRVPHHPAAAARRGTGFLPGAARERADDALRLALPRQSREGAPARDRVVSAGAGAAGDPADCRGARRRPPTRALPGGGLPREGSGALAPGPGPEPPARHHLREPRAADPVRADPVAAR